MYPDFEQLLSILNAEKADYLVIGGYAVMVHAQPRATKDLDILIGSDPDNAVAVWRALARFGAPLDGVTAENLIEPGTFFRMGSPPIMIDILSQISGVSFSEARSRAILAVVNEETGLQAPFIAAADLITNKLASGRPEDLGDVAAIRQAQQSEIQGRKG